MMNFLILIKYLYSFYLSTCEVWQFCIVWRAVDWASSNRLSNNDDDDEKLCVIWIVILTFKAVITTQIKQQNKTNHRTHKLLSQWWNNHIGRLGTNIGAGRGWPINLPRGGRREHTAPITVPTSVKRYGTFWIYRTLKKWPNSKLVIFSKCNNSLV
jgi:hypothetical protein